MKGLHHWFESLFARLRRETRLSYALDKFDDGIGIMATFDEKQVDEFRFNREQAQDVIAYLRLTPHPLYSHPNAVALHVALADGIELLMAGGDAQAMRNAGFACGEPQREIRKYGQLVWKPANPAAPLDAMLRRINNLAEKFFKEEGALEHMMWLAEGLKGQALILTPLYGETREEQIENKKAVADEMRNLFAEHGVTRYAFACEAFMNTPLPRSSSELPDNEGTVFVTAVPGAPFQIFGRRGKNDGGLYVSAVCNEDAATVIERVRRVREDTGMSVEVVTGPEAEALINTMQKVKAERENPDCRAEVVALLATDGRQTLGAERAIIRPPQGGPYLSKFKITEQDSNTPRGRFEDLLPAMTMH
jgi:hypothetical protein